MKNKWLISAVIIVIILIAIVIILQNSSGEEKQPEVISSPFGTILMNGADTLDRVSHTENVAYDLDDIERSGEIIVLTIEGKQTFYEKKRRVFGEEYLLAERFARNRGLFIRGELCADTLDMIEKLRDGVGDVIAVPLPDSLFENKDYQLCKIQVEWENNGSKLFWAVRQTSPQLKTAFNEWYKPELRKAVKEEEKLLAEEIERGAFPSIFNIKKGKISIYDAYFRKYAPKCGWDWRLLAAQSYQESMFNPNAISFAGACGLMQIMPSTARSLGMQMDKIMDPETNVKTAVQLIKVLDGKLSDIPGKANRMKFILASYNGGINHIRDAQRLAKAAKESRYNDWEVLVPYVMMLQQREYYANNPNVQYGYLRATETIGYVKSVMQRWDAYRKVAK